MLYVADTENHALRYVRTFELSFNLFDIFSRLNFELLKWPQKLTFSSLFKHKLAPHCGIYLSDNLGITPIVSSLSSLVEEFQAHLLAFQGD